MTFTAAIKNDMSAVGTLHDWLGAGLKPVARELSELRASVCVECPRHSKERFWYTLKTEVALAIKKQVELKNKMKVETTKDNQLGECEICGCVMLLKCHVPIKHIAENTSESELQLFKEVEKCWVPKEISQ